MRSGGRWPVIAALLAGVAFAWPTYVRYFGVHPGPMVAALLIAAAMYLPSLWVIRYLDRRQPEPPGLFWGTIAFVILFAPITSRVMYSVIDAGILPYWVVVGPFEELTKLLPLVLIAGLGLRGDLSTRDGLVYGALGGLGFAMVEFAANFSTHGLNDLYGKCIGPLALVLLIANTLVMNLFVWPVLAWGILNSGAEVRAPGGRR